MSIESVIPSNHFILCWPLILFLSNLSQHQGLFQWISSWHQVAKVLVLQLQHQYSTECSGLISIRINCCTRVSQLSSQAPQSERSILRCSTYFLFQLSHPPYMTTGKTIALTRQTFVDKVMPLLFNILSRLVITFLPRSKCLFMSWLKFTVHIYLKPNLENFEHYFASMQDECNCAVVWTFFGIAFLWDWNKNWPFPVLWPLLSFPNLLA